MPIKSSHKVYSNLMTQRHLWSFNVSQILPLCSQQLNVTKDTYAALLSIKSSHKVYSNLMTQRHLWSFHASKILQLGSR